MSKAFTFFKFMLHFRQGENMKKNINIYIKLAVLLLSLGFVGCLYLKDKKVSYNKSLYVVPTMFDDIKDNSVWCPTMQLVWNDVKTNLAKQDIKFVDNNSFAENLNKESFTDEMISDSYYYKTYGLRTISLKNEIEKSINKKFGQNSDILNEFKWYKDKSDAEKEEEYIFYSMLYRKFNFLSKFKKLENGSFNNSKDVSYFGVTNNKKSSAKEEITVLFYKDKDNFAISIDTKEKDKVIIYKNPVGNNFNEIYDYLKKNYKESETHDQLGANDKFKMPYLDFKVLKSYEELKNKSFMSKDNKEYIITDALQTINFKIDEAGGVVKSEAAIGTKAISSGNMESRTFYVDKTFALFLLEEGRDVPYFATKISDAKSFQ